MKQIIYPLYFAASLFLVACNQATKPQVKSIESCLQVETVKTDLKPLELDFVKSHSEQITLYSPLPEHEAELILRLINQYHAVLLEMFDISHDVRADDVEIFIVPSALQKHLSSRNYSGGFYTQRYGKPIIMINFDRYYYPHNIANVIYHEYFHYFHDQYFDANLPDWLNEGLAEYLSTIKFKSQSSQAEIGENSYIRWVDNVLTSRPPPKQKISEYVLNSREVIGSLSRSNYDFIKRAKYQRDRQIIFYQLSWIIADWLMETQKGKALFDKIKLNLNSGNPIAGLFDKSFEEDITTHALERYNTLEITYPKLGPQNIQHTSVSTSEFYDKWYFILGLFGNIELEYHGMGDIPKSVRENAVEIIQNSDLASFDFRLGQAVWAMQDRDYKCYEALFDKLFETNNDSNLNTLKVKLDTYLYRRRVSKKNQVAGLLNQIDIENISEQTELDYLTAFSSYRIRKEEHDIYERVKSTNILARNPFVSINFLDAVISSGDLDLAELILQRFELWAPKNEANERLIRRQKSAIKRAKLQAIEQD